MGLQNAFRAGFSVFAAAAAATLILTLAAVPAGACTTNGGCNICDALNCDCVSSGSKVSCRNCDFDFFQLDVTPTATVQVIGPRRARIQVSGYETTAMSSGINCMTALPPLVEIRSIDNVTLVGVADDRPIDALGFRPDAVAGWEFAALDQRLGGTSATPAPWNGFTTSVAADVPDGLDVYFVVEVTLEPGVSALDLRDALRRSGAFGTSEANADGTLHEGHEGIRSLENIRLLPTRAPLAKPIGPLR